MVEYLQIGKIVNTHGVRGEVRVIPLTDDPRRFEALKKVFLEKDNALVEHAIKGVKYTKGSVILKLSDIDTMEAAEAVKDCFLVIDRKNAVKLPKDSFFICDILESEVFDEKGALLGILVDVLQTGSNDVYVIKNKEGRELLIPALKSVVNSVLPEQKRIDVTIPKGLFDDEV
jgi:16S rRNA processing protein RimM